MHPNDKIINTKPIRLNLNPYGFLHYGRSFFDTAKAFKQSAYFSPVPYYLYCHAIELLLKAFLLAKGVPKTALPKPALRHDLDKILKKAEELGLGAVVTITEDQQKEIGKANKYYADKGFEYFNVIKAVRAYSELPDLSSLEWVASALLTQLEAICLNAD